ncbi:hypothetical protein [Candidatus Poriferisocius sp.]|uniref:hypothetical protein n=1 Tax=Candidatus Poriferisocius sp. TaxID=3101276 RepID=UPI003B025929
MVRLKEAESIVADGSLFRVLGAVAVGLGAVLLAASGFAVWVDAFGSELTGFRLAELIGDFGGDVEGVPPSWVGAVWYLLPLSAGGCWLGLFRRKPPTASSAHVWMGAAVVLGVGLYMLSQGPRLGPLLALAGGLLIGSGGAVGRLNRADSGPQDL